MVVNKKSKLFGIKLRLLRNKHKIKCQPFADTVRCSTRALRRWERGDAYPLPIYLEAIETVFPGILGKKNKGRIR